MHCISDTDTYRRFNESRGQRTLEREGWGTGLEWSLRRPFDESVLLWHLATDFGFYHQMPTSESPSNEVILRSREISNYMAYLLFVNPEMLMAGARSKLFRYAYKELKKMARGNTPMGDEADIAQKIIQSVCIANGSGIIHDAWKLAQELMEMCSQGPEGEKKMWRVIQGVWVEMLCFSASRCRGYLNAKSLGKGGECLSYIWLLLSYMGMETLAERLQRTELHAQGDMGAARPTSTPLVMAAGDENA